MLRKVAVELLTVWVIAPWAGIATRYRMGSPGIETRWGANFPHPSRLALGSIQPPVQWVPGLSRGESGRGVGLTTHPHLAPSVGLYICSPLGLSWPVLGDFVRGCTVLLEEHIHSYRLNLNKMHSSFPIMTFRICVRKEHRTEYSCSTDSKPCSRFNGI